jgi:hypothetical protein
MLLVSKEENTKEHFLVPINRFTVREDIMIYINEHLEFTGFLAITRAWPSSQQVINNIKI